MAKSAFDYPHLGKVLFIFAAMVFISCAILGGCRRPAAAEPFCGCATRMEGFASGAAPGPKPATFYFLGVSWCGYCKQAKPVWEKLEEDAKANPLEKEVQLRYVDCEAEPELAASFKVESYPTFLLVKSDGTRVPYEGGRSVPEFRKFLEQAL